MRKIYCDFCNDEITVIYHNITVDNHYFEICEKCYKKIMNELKKCDN